MIHDAQTLMRYDINKKSMLLAYVLWWFLGTFGVHRLYLGRTVSGLAMLLTAVISIALTIVLIGFFGLIVLGAWWLVDAFLLPGMVRQHNTRLMDRLLGQGF
jgi:TM2 domain-containing membrane protein YozV